MASLKQVSFLVSFLVLLHLSVRAEKRKMDCESWGPPRVIGELDRAIKEASGLAISTKYPSRFYHINDSGDAGVIYQSDSYGALQKKIILDIQKPLDGEALSLGPCGVKFSSKDSKQCLYFGDIGDNNLKRTEILITVLEEAESFSTPAAVLRQHRLKYPSGARNAESMAVHPNGDLFIISKAQIAEDDHVGPAEIFTLSAEELWGSQEALKTMRKIGEINLPEILKEHEVFGQIATDMSIANDGKSFLILTYQKILQFHFDIAKFDKNFLDFTIIHPKQLPQQEGISFLPRSSTSFVYSTEFHKSAPLVQMDCSNHTML